MPDTIAPDRIRPGTAALVMPGRLSVARAPGCARVILRGEPLALGAAFGIALSTDPCRAAVAGDRAALWLGPDEWLLMAPALDAATPVAAGAVVDVSHRQVGFVLEGAGAPDVLAAGCPLDLHITAFPPGMCTRTVFGKAEIILWRQEADRFHVEVWRSFAAYVESFMRSAAAAGV